MPERIKLQFKDGLLFGGSFLFNFLGEELRFYRGLDGAEAYLFPKIIKKITEKNPLIINKKIKIPLGLLVRSRKAFKQIIFFYFFLNSFFEKDFFGKNKKKIPKDSFFLGIYIGILLRLFIVRRIFSLKEFVSHKKKFNAFLDHNSLQFDVYNLINEEFFLIVLKVFDFDNIEEKKLKRMISTTKKIAIDIIEIIS